MNNAVKYVFVLWVCDLQPHLRGEAMAKITLKSVSEMKESNKYIETEKKPGWESSFQPLFI